MRRINFLINPLFLLLFGIGTFVSSCYPGPGALENSDLDIVATFYDEGYDFSANSTYYLVDSVMDIGDRRILLSGKYDRQILDQIDANLQALGYIKESDPDNNPPDMMVTVSKVATYNIEAYEYYSYWWDYWGWYTGWPGYGYPIGPGWAPVYPWAGTVVYTYTTGSLLIDMMDPEKADTDTKRLPVFWSGGINGLLEGDDADIQARLAKHIDQCFDQSPYLKK